MELIVDTLQKNKWYHTTDFSVEELSQLLPSGTQVEVETEVMYYNIATEPPTKTTHDTVERVTTSAFDTQALIETSNNAFLKEWFKIVQED